MGSGPEFFIFALWTCRGLREATNQLGNEAAGRPREIWSMNPHDVAAHEVARHRSPIAFIPCPPSQSPICCLPVPPPGRLMCHPVCLLPLGRAMSLMCPGVHGSPGLCDSAAQTRQRESAVSAHKHKGSAPQPSRAPRCTQCGNIPMDGLNTKACMGRMGSQIG